MKVKIGDELMIVLLDGLDERDFGTGTRLGRITDMGIDILSGEPMLTLDDDGPPIYTAHIDWARWVQSRTDPPQLSDRFVFVGR